MSWEDKKIEGAEEEFTLTLPIGVVDSKGHPKLVPLKFKVWASSHESAVEKLREKFIPR